MGDMSLLHPKTLEEKIVHLLQKGGMNTHDLLEKLSAKEGITKQGFYAALRRLKAEDSVVVHKKVVALNTTWIQKMRDAVSKMGHAYTQGGEASDILSLADKESISYSFNTIQQLDAFWGHMQNIIVHATPANEPVYTYDPHYWFYIGRQDTERALVDEVTSLGKQFLMTVGGDTPLDKVIKPEFNTELRQYHIERLFDDDAYYVVVIGDYIFETRLDEKIVRAVEDVYMRHAKLTGEAAQELAHIPKIKVRARLKISRNRLRARKLKAKLGKNFFVRDQNQNAISR